jgi:MarR family transcriptional regulator, organic hydroperoxide resistance regulator
MTEGHVSRVARNQRRSVLAWMHLIRIHWRMGHEHHAIMAEHGLTPSQFFVLSILASEPGISQQELSQRLSVTKGNISGMIERLEGAGFVIREADPQDRRTYRVYATDAGHRAFEAASPGLDAHIAEKFSVLTDEEQTTLLNLLARLDRSLRKE